MHGRNVSSVSMTQARVEHAITGKRMILESENGMETRLGMVNGLGPKMVTLYHGHYTALYFTIFRPIFHQPIWMCHRPLLRAKTTTLHRV